MQGLSMMIISITKFSVNPSKWFAWQDRFFTKEIQLYNLTKVSHNSVNLYWIPTKVCDYSVLLLQQKRMA